MSAPADPAPPQPPLELTGSIWLRAGEQNWGGAQRIELLAQIDLTGSITAAAKAAGLSYKGAWDAIDTMNNLAGEPLVLRATGGKGGGGARLTGRARQLITTFRALAAAHQRFMQQLAEQGVSPAGDIDLVKRLMFKTSARNRLLGTVARVRTGSVNDEIELRIAGDHRVVATITRASTEELALSPGRSVIALIKAPAVMLAVPHPGLRLSAENQIEGRIALLRAGAVNDEVVIDVPGGATLVAVVTRESTQAMGLAEGDAVLACFSASAVILGVVD
ncbi:MAG: TOBE domain-containing protein [Bordetella sp.]|nr:TOBE domain-containing protein [Bordetella sp.]